MKEDDRYRHLSPLVKQDLNLLDANADTRRLAVKSLKLMVKQLDAHTLPRFIFQISESHEPAATRSYVIYVFEEIGRVHGKLIVTHIPRIMGFIVRSSSAIGSCHVLQEACAKVTASLALCGIDSNTSQEDAEEIMREICTPLIDALAGKLDAVAACAASCIHALVETDKWKYVREEMVHKVCHRTFVALGEKPTRTAAHLHLICSLASANPDIISSHGGSLLRAAEEILKVTTNPWQLRKAAAQLLLSVLTILEKDKLQRELNSAINVLDSCRLDKMQQVRTAVSDALHAARMLASGNNVYHPALDMAASPIHKSKERGDWSSRSVCRLYEQGSGPKAPTHPGEVVSPSPVSRPVDNPQILTDLNTVGLFSPEIATASPGTDSLTSQESLHVPYSPTSSSLESFEVPSPAQSVGSPKEPGSPHNSPQDMASVHSPTSTSLESVEVSSPAHSEDAPKGPGSPHYPPQDMANVHSPQSATPPGTSPSSSIIAVEECESPSRRLSAEFNVQSQNSEVSCTSLEGDDTGNDDHSFQAEVPLTSDPSISLPTSQQNMLSVEVQKIIETQDLKDVDIITSKLPEHLRETSNEKYDPRTFIRCLLNAIDGSTPMMRISSMNVHLVMPSNADERSKNEDGNETLSESAEVDKREILNSNPPICVENYTVSEVEHDAGNSNGGGCASHEQLKLLEHRDNALDHAGVDTVDAESEETESLNEAKDLLPFVTPTELVHSPSSSSIPDPRGSVTEQDEPLLSTELPTNDVDAHKLVGETSSEASWSVRDNPIVSERSFRIENSGEETEAHRKRAQDSFPKVHKVGSPDSWSPREIHMILPASEAHLSVGDDTSLDTSNPVDNSDRACCPMTDDADHQSSPSSVLAEQSPTSSKPRTSIQAIKDMHGGPNGLSSLLHEDGKSQVCEHKATGQCDDAVVRIKSDCTTPSSKKYSRRHAKEVKGLRIRLRVIAHGWKKLRSCTETALRGTLCVAIALPLAVIVAKSFNGSRDGRLVPT